MSSINSNQSYQSRIFYQSLADQIIQGKKSKIQIKKDIKDESLRIIFNVFQKLSYGLFAVGITPTMQSQALDVQKFMAYIESQRSSYLLYIIVFLGSVEMAILKAIKEQNKISSRLKKISNFIVDIVRAILYMLLLVFVQPFVFGDSNGILHLSFWIYAITVALFIDRKYLKWRYYLFDSKGRANFSLWEVKDLQNKQNLIDHAQLIDKTVKKLIEDPVVKSKLSRRFSRPDPEEMDKTFDELSSPTQ